MGALWAVVRNWFQGKKTILGGTVVMGAAVAGVAVGRLDPVTGLTIFGAGLAIAGHGAKVDRHQAELLTALQGVAAIGLDMRTGQTAQALQAGEATVAALAPSAIAMASPSLHISGSTADEVVQIAKGLSQTTHVTTANSYPPPLPLRPFPDMNSMNTTAFQSGGESK